MDMRWCHKEAQQQQKENLLSDQHEPCPRRREGSVEDHGESTIPKMLQWASIKDSCASHSNYGITRISACLVAYLTLYRIASYTPAMSSSLLHLSTQRTNQSVSSSQGLHSKRWQSPYAWEAVARRLWVRDQPGWESKTLPQGRRKEDGKKETDSRGGAPRIHLLSDSKILGFYSILN